MCECVMFINICVGVCIVGTHVFLYIVNLEFLWKIHDMYFIVNFILSFAHHNMNFYVET